MLALPNVEVHAQIYSSANSLVYRGTSQPDNTPVILKVLKQDYPTPSERKDSGRTSGTSA